MGPFPARKTSFSRDVLFHVGHPPIRLIVRQFRSYVLNQNYKDRDESNRKRQDAYYSSVCLHIAWNAARAIKRS